MIFLIFLLDSNGEYWLVYIYVLKLMESKSKGNINLKLINVNKCKTMAWRALEIKKRRKTKIMKHRSHAGAQPLALQRASRIIKGRIWSRAMLECGSLRSSLPMSARKIKKRLEIPHSLSPLSSPSVSLSLLSPKISHIWYFFSILYHYLPLLTS